MFRAAVNYTIPCTIRAGKQLFTPIRAARTVRGGIKKRAPQEANEMASPADEDFVAEPKVAVDISLEPNVLPPSDASWSWVPPAQSAAPPATLLEKHRIPILKRVHLTPDEIKRYLESNGAEDVVVLKLKEPLDTFTHFVFASASSARLIRRLLQGVVDAIKERELFKYIGAKGVEGARSEEWQVVDCHSFLVHGMLPDTRKHLDLETQWSMDVRPSLPYCEKQSELDAMMNRLLDQYPAPVEYQRRAMGETVDRRDAPEVKVL